MKICFFKDKIGFNILEGETVIETKVFNNEEDMYNYIFTKINAKEYLNIEL